MEIGAFAAKNTLGSLLDRVEQGEEILITRHGRPVAKLVSSTGSTDRTQALAAGQRILARAAELSRTGKQAPVAWRELKKDRDQGRP